jgi:ribonuclease J
MLEVVPLGGVGEFGMNMLAVTWDQTTIVVDAGVMFPIPNCWASTGSSRT